MSMDSNKIKSIFHKAIEHCEPGKWAAFLDDACEGDENLRRRVEGCFQPYTCCSNDLGTWCVEFVNMRVYAVYQGTVDTCDELAGCKSGVALAVDWFFCVKD